MGKRRKQVTKRQMERSPAPEVGSLAVTPEQLAGVLVNSPPKTAWDYEQET